MAKQRRPGRYVVRLVVVLAVVAAVIGLGVVWRSSSAASLVANDRGFGDRRPPAGATGGDHFGGDRRNSAGGLSSIDDLGQTVFVVCIIVAGVVVFDKARRRRNPITPGRTSP